MQINRVSLNDAASSRPVPRAEGAIAQVGPLAIGRARLQPGWRWSVDLQPTVGTSSCQAHHLHVLIAGRFAAQMDDGERAAFEPGDVFDLPPGHDAWVVGDEVVELLDVSGNVADFGTPSSSGRQVVTMLMSDIVDSTPIATRMGDGRWRQKLADHHRVVRSQIARFRGRELDTTGDGFFVAFDSAGAAVRCAEGMRAGVSQLGLELRVGIHTGEIEVAAEGVRGIAVHATARVMSAALPSQILVSAITRALTEGTDLSFEGVGSFMLKGIDSPMDLHAVG
jgi:class 3 adenylate cyclase